MFTHRNMAGGLVILWIVLAGLPGLVNGAAAKGHAGGGKADDGSISLSAMPSKGFVGDQITLTASLTAPRDDDGEEKTYRVDVGFNHQTSNLTPRDTHVPAGGTAKVQWTAAFTSDADENGNIIMIAQIGEDHRGDYEEDSKLPGEGDSSDRDGRSHTTFTVKPGKVYLLVKKNDQGTPGKKVDAVPAGDSVFLESRIKDQGGDLSGKTIYYRIEHRDSLNDDWEGPPDTGDVGEQYPQSATTDDEGVAELNMTTQARYYRATVWYDADGSADGYDVQSPDDGETDQDKLKGDFKVNKVVLYGKNKQGNFVEGGDRFVFGSNNAPLQFRAEIDPDNATVRHLAGRFKWTLKDVDKPGPDPDWHDSHPQAPKITYGIGIGKPGPNPYYSTFGIDVLPHNNGGFGKHELKVQVVGWNKEKTAKPRLFFDRNGDAHPDPGKDTTANWYYYWSQDGGPGVCAYSRSSNTSVYAAWRGATSYFGRYRKSTDAISLTNKAAAADPQKWPTNKATYAFPQTGNPNPNVVAFTIRKTTAPEFVNLTFAHERTHRKLDMQPMKQG